MKSLFDLQHNQEISTRISQLHPQTAALWGKMSAAQMLAHCQAPLRVALGEQQLKRGLIGFLFGNIAKKQMLGEAPFKKNMPTDKSFIIKGQPDFETTRRDLLTLITRFQQMGPEGLSKAPHPFFGPLKPEEWDTLQWKHLDHHLNQFGA